MSNKDATPSKTSAKAENIKKQLVLTGADIVSLGEEAELLVGGKNYNTALISQIEEIQAPHFRAISSVAFHRLLDETRVSSKIVRAVVDREYARIDWNDPEINQDPDFLQKFVRQLGKQIHDTTRTEVEQGHAKLRTFINTVVEGFATSPEGIDQLRKRSVMVQAAILSVDLPPEVDAAVRGAYAAICRENGDDMTPVAVRSSAAGEDSRKKAFAGLQDTYLNMVGADKVEYTRDYLPGTRTYMADGKVEQIELKGQNVMYYELEGGTTFIIRPSGTEPKVKVYIMAKGDSKADAAAKVDALVAAAKEIVK